MAFKLIESAQTRWRAVNAAYLVVLVRAGAVFKNGKLIERPDGFARACSRLMRRKIEQAHAQLTKRSNQ